MKPPIVFDVIKEKQQAQIRNYKGKRNKKFTVGQKVYVRNYRNPNKAGWSPATIEKQLGQRNYTCLLTYENRNIKRHLDQIRDAHVEVDLELNDSISNDTLIRDGEGESAESEHGSQDSQSFQSLNASTNNTADDSMNSPGTSDQNESIPDVYERPGLRACAALAKDKITSMFTSNQRK